MIPITCNSLNRLFVRVKKSDLSLIESWSTTDSGFQSSNQFADLLRGFSMAGDTFTVSCGQSFEIVKLADDLGDRDASMSPSSLPLSPSLASKSRSVGIGGEMIFGDCAAKKRHKSSKDKKVPRDSDEIASLQRSAGV
jgi:hypothetical protein